MHSRIVCLCQPAIGIGNLYLPFVPHTFYPQEGRETHRRSLLVLGGSGHLSPDCDFPLFYAYVQPERKSMADNKKPVICFGHDSERRLDGCTFSQVACKNPSAALTLNLI